MRMTLLEIYRQESNQNSCKLKVQALDGTITYITGFRPGYNDGGGCMGGGTSEALFGENADGMPWYHAPKGFSPEDKVWKVVP